MREIELSGPRGLLRGPESSKSCTFSRAGRLKARKVGILVAPAHRVSPSVAGRPLPGGAATLENQPGEPIPSDFQLTCQRPLPLGDFPFPTPCKREVFKRKGPLCVIAGCCFAPCVRSSAGSRLASFGSLRALEPIPLPRQALVADMLENRSFTHPFAENSRRFSRWKTARFSPFEKPCSLNAHRGFCRFPVAVENNPHPLSMDF